MGEFTPIVGLDRLRRITKVDDGTFGEVNGRITALLLVGIDEPFSGCLINHCVLVKFISICTDIASSRDILYIQLPFDPQIFRRVILAVMFGFFLCGLYLRTVSQANKYPIE